MLAYAARWNLQLYVKARLDDEAKSMSRVDKQNLLRAALVGFKDCHLTCLQDPKMISIIFSAGPSVKVDPGELPLILRNHGEADHDGMMNILRAIYSSPALDSNWRALKQDSWTSLSKKELGELNRSYRRARIGRLNPFRKVWG